MSDRIGTLRRSHVVMTYGPGAIIDFRAPGTGAALSGVLAGLEEWDACASSKGLTHLQSIHEPRLQKRLDVGGFRLPPVKHKDPRTGDEDESNLDVLPVLRFPQWLQCPNCDLIRKAEDWGKDAGKPERWCTASGCTADGLRVHVVPVRFVVACERGHLEEFPWKWWAACSCVRPRLKLETTGPGLSGKVVRCLQEGCAGSTGKSLEHAFGKTALEKLPCSGSEFWLNLQTPGCPETPRVLQRGASNVYWGVVESSLDIPPFSDDPGEIFGRYWPAISKSARENWPTVVSLLGLEAQTGLPEAVLLHKLNAWKEALDADSPKAPLEWQEYLQFKNAVTQHIQEKEFEVRPEPVPPEFVPFFSGLARGMRLREVRAQTGFTRIHPPSGMFRSSNSKAAALSRQHLDWLPAVEMRGEGIFLQFDLDAIKRWEAQTVAHLAEFNARLKKDMMPNEAFRTVNARFLLIHSFSHAVMRRLSLSCGYSSSALRERLYVNVDDNASDMTGVLIHTGSPDAEGTLGGLVRQGKSDRLRDTILGALQEMTWCSSDPVCISGIMTLSSPRNGAACHACLLVPETSCQQFNLFLDRTLLVGTDAHPEYGFFRPLLELP